MKGAETKKTEEKNGCGETEGTVFSVARWCLDDGDGIRTNIFLKGCPLRCAWCHNAESQSFERELYFGGECLFCGECRRVCPAGAHVFRGTEHILLRENCTLCGKCAAVCPTGALRTVGEKRTVRELFGQILRDRDFYGTGGGITLTGGEPMAQADFCLALAKYASEEKISVTMETSGFCDAGKLLEILPFVDRFLFDCKASEKDHARLVGTDDRKITENLALLCENGAHITLRCPIVPNANLTDDFLQKIASLANRFEAIDSVTLLPYHRTGADKSSALGKAPQTVFRVPDKALLAKIAAVLSQKIRRPIEILH